jgi:hypothetical protein
MPRPKTKGPAVQFRLPIEAHEMLLEFAHTRNYNEVAAELVAAALYERAGRSREYPWPEPPQGVFFDRPPADVFD